MRRVLGAVLATGVMLVLARSSPPAAGAGRAPCVSLPGVNCDTTTSTTEPTTNTTGGTTSTTSPATSTSGTVTTSTPDTTSGSSSAESDASQGPAPTFTPQGRVPLPKRVAAPATSTASDGVPAPWVLLDVAIAGTTAITGVVLVRKGRVPFG